MAVVKKKKLTPVAKPTQVAKPVSGGPKPKEGDDHTYEGYCVKCKAKGQIIGKVSLAKNGSLIAKGPHSCGTTVCRILGKPDA